MKLNGTMTHDEIAEQERKLVVFSVRDGPLVLVQDEPATWGEAQRRSGELANQRNAMLELAVVSQASGNRFVFWTVPEAWFDSLEPHGILGSKTCKTS